MVESFRSTMKSFNWLVHKFALVLAMLVLVAGAAGNSLTPGRRLLRRLHIASDLSCTRRLDEDASDRGIDDDLLPNRLNHDAFG